MCLQLFINPDTSSMVSPMIILTRSCRLLYVKHKQNGHINCESKRWATDDVRTMQSHVEQNNIPRATNIESFQNITSSWYDSGFCVVLQMRHRLHSRRTCHTQMESFGSSLSCYSCLCHDRHHCQHQWRLLSSYFSDFVLLLFLLVCWRWCLPLRNNAKTVIEWADPILCVLWFYVSHFPMCTHFY